MAGKNSDSPLLPGVIVIDMPGGCLISGTTTTEEGATKRGAWGGDIAIVRACDALFAFGRWPGVCRGGRDGGHEEGNNQGSEACHLNSRVLKLLSWSECEDSKVLAIED